MNLKAGEHLRDIAEVLARCEQVTKYDSAEEKEAWTLAHDFLDLESSFRTFVEEQLPKLRSADLKPDEVRELLGDIGEEFRHIVYHIRNLRYYRYVG